MKVYRKTNQEELAALKKKWYETDKDRILGSKKEYYQKNKEKIADTCKLYRKKNKEKCAAQKKAYRQTPEGKAVRKAVHHRRRARKLGNGIGTSYKSWLRKIQKQPTFICYYCEKEHPTSTLHVDHLYPLSKGGIDGLENVRAACPQCNLSKRAKSPWEWWEYMMEHGFPIKMTL